MAPKKKRLSNLEALEISLVDKGANMRKHLIAKADRGAPADGPDDTLGPAEQAVIKAMDALDPELVARLHETVEGLARSRVLKAAAVAAGTPSTPAANGDGEVPNPDMSEAAQAALKAAFRMLAPHFKEITDADMDACQAKVGIEGGDVDPDDEEEESEDQLAEAGDRGVPRPVNKAAKGKEKDKAAQKKDEKDAAAEGEEGPEPGDEEEEDEVGEGKKPWEKKKAPVKKAANSHDPKTVTYNVAKAATGDLMELTAFSDEQRVQIEKALAARDEQAQKLADENKALIAKAASYEEAVKKQAEALAAEQAHRVDRELQDEVKKFAGGLAIEEDKLVAVLKAAKASGDADQYNNLVSILKAKSVQSAKAAEYGADIFKEHGTRLAGASDTGSELKKLVEKAAESNDGRTEAQRLRDAVLNTDAGRAIARERERARQGGN